MLENRKGVGKPTVPSYAESPKNLCFTLLRAGTIQYIKLKTYVHLRTSVVEP